MNSNVDPSSVRRTAGIPIPVHAAHSIPVLALGMGLSLFLAISYVLCVLGYLFLPSLPIAHSALSIFLPGFTLLSWSSFCLGAGGELRLGVVCGSGIRPHLQFLCCTKMMVFSVPSRKPRQLSTAQFLFNP